MKIDWPALAMRWALAWFLLCVVTLFLAAVGAAQTFLEGTQSRLFQWARLLTWLGLGATVFGLGPWCWGRGRRRALVALTLGYGGLVVAVLTWDVWLHPAAGLLPW